VHHGIAMVETDYRAFAEEIDALKARAMASVGDEDVRHVKRLDRFSRAMEIGGRLLIHFSPEPVTFFLGVGLLWIHKQLQATEIGHSALHGVYDRLPGAERFHSRKFRWDVPIDEASWREMHNLRHHGSTNIAGKDPDIQLGPARLTEQTPPLPYQRHQLALTLAVVWPNFGWLAALHFSGLKEQFVRTGLEPLLETPPERSPDLRRRAWKRTLRKWLPYYLVNFVFFPLLAGPLFWKVLLGNWLAEVMRDIYSAATIYCGHTGPEVASFPVGTKAHGRGQWYAMQVAATNDFVVSRPLSLLCGGLDYQIEHHLFPALPPERIRQIAPEVRAVCERHGVHYRSSSWPEALRTTLGYIGELGRFPLPLD
jgi:fatty acid desaturase